MKKAVLATLCFILLTGLTASQLMAAEVVHLTMTTNVMDKHASIAEFYKPAFAKIAEKTNGTLIINYYNPNTICPEAEIFDSVATGQVDIGSHYTNRNAGKLPVTAIYFQPMLFTNSLSAAKTAMEFYDAVPEAQAEYENAGVMVLGFISGVPTDIQFRDKAATTLEELKGMKIIATDSYSMRIVRLLGANPIQIPTTDAYLSLQRNMAQGVNLPMPVLRSAKISEATKECLIVGLRNPVQWVGMNKQRFDSLSPEHQAAILEFLSGDALVTGNAQVIDAAAHDDKEFLEKGGYKFVTIDPVERERWRNTVVDDCRKSWLEEVNQRGIQNAEALFDKFVEIAHKNVAEFGAK